MKDRFAALFLLLALALSACGGGGAPPPPEEEEPTWTRPELDGAISGAADAVVVRAVWTGETALVAWSEGGALYLAADGGSGFGEPRRVSSEGTTLYAFDLAAGPGGEVVLAWREDDRVRAAVGEGDELGSPEELAQTTDPNLIVAAVDGEGDAWVAWTERDGGGYKVLVRHRGPGGWEPPDEFQDAQSPALAAHGDLVALAWEDGNQEIRAALHRADSGWGAPESLGQWFLTPPLRVAAGAKGVLVAWRAMDMIGLWDGVRLAQYDGAAWAGGNLGAMGARDPAIAALDDGFALAWVQSLGGPAAVLAEVRGDEPGRVQMLSLPGTGSGFPAAAAAGGEALVAWIQDNSVYAAEFSAEGWRFPGPGDALSPAGTDVAGKPPAVAVAGEGRALVAWIQKDEAGVQRVYVAERR